MNRGELVSADVTYCLCFSIIMLNTDLHNKNMKEESRMSLEDYIKYNTVYGDMNKNRPLKRELLEGIYESIQKEQLLVVDDVRSKSGGDGVAKEREHHHQSEVGGLREREQEVLPRERAVRADDGGGVEAVSDACVA